MNLKQLIEILLKVSDMQPAVNHSYEGDVYEINTLSDTEYANIVITQGAHNVDTDFSEFGFTLFYIDRLTKDKSNKLEIQSLGIEVLKNILSTLEEYYDVEVSKPYSITTFTERFADECAGAYAQINIQVNNNGICPDEY